MPRAAISLYSDIIRRLYVEESHSLREICAILRESYNVRSSPIRVKQILNSHGIDTGKSSLTGCRRLVVCRNCGTPFEIPRSRFVESQGRRPKGRSSRSSRSSSISTSTGTEAGVHTPSSGVPASPRGQTPGADAGTPPGTQASPRGRDGTSSHHLPRSHYCSWTCRLVWLEEHGRAQASARRLVEYLMDSTLPADAVCHFVDGNTSNVIKQNIRVFTSTRRHLEEHRSKEEV